MRERGERSSGWDALAPAIVHPLGVAIVEALSWLERPLSAPQLTRLVDDGRFGLSRVAYQLIRLADAGMLERVGGRPADGSVEMYCV